MARASAWEPGKLPPLGVFCFVSCTVLLGFSPTMNFTDISKTLTTPPGEAQHDQGFSEMKAYPIV